MNKLKAKAPLDNEKGLATIEAVVLIVLFVSLIYYSFGFFGVVHTAVLHNIHARTYAFETFRNRTNLMYFRSNRSGGFHYYNQGTRLHGVNTDQGSANEQIATERPISLGINLDENNRTEETHNQQVFGRVPASGRNTSVEVNPVWIMVLYGICLNSNCGGGQ